MLPFDHYAAHDDTHMMEWVDGVVTRLPPLSPRQSHVRDRLLAQFAAHAEMNGWGLVVPAPFTIRMPEEMRRGREPDLLFVPYAFIEAMHERYVDSHGVGLVVEITDTRNRYLDCFEKFHDYERAGIPEYWVADVDLRVVRVFVLIGKHYVRAKPDPQGHLHSQALKGFILAPETLWR
ncbi:MAG: hypothetical protein KatS3mg052_2394 [Candidatus Roseilinea sp.]|nr:MAG: hypothetical protein KatS3mg052_2394 [Candidatus Roseilinea sp.]